MARDPFSKAEVPDISVNTTEDKTVVEVPTSSLDVSSVPNNKLNKPIIIEGKKTLTPNQKSLKMQKKLALAKAGVGILNAQIEFSQIESKGKTNIMLANAQFNESLNIGRQQALRAETQGFARGEQAVLSAVAQGQDASGGIAQSAQLAEETLGILNAAQIENNAIRQAYGFKQEAALTQHDINLAEINRNAQIATSALSGAIALI